MDAVQLSLSSKDVSDSKMFGVKGFGREGLLVREGENQESTTSIPSVPIGSGVNARSNKDKSRTHKQKHGLDGKRGDRKNPKAPMKNKLDSFFAKNRLSSNNSSSGGNGILGIYGLKTDTHAVTEHLDDLSLKELLDGSYKSPILSQDKEKKFGNTNENLLHSIRKVRSILRPRRIVGSLNNVEVDSGFKNMETGLRESGPCVANKTDSDERDDVAERNSSSKVEDASNEHANPADSDASLLHQPNVILEKLGLQPAKDLESLLMDLSKPAVSARTTHDLRAGKSLPYKGNIPPFSWSHSYTGSCKSNLDMSKLTNKSTSQSRWVRIGSTGCTQRENADCFSDLDLFACDHNLVSLSQLNLGLSKNDTTLKHVRLPWSDMGSLGHHPTEKGKLKFGENDAVSASFLLNKLHLQDTKDKFTEEDQSKRRKSGSYYVSGCSQPQLQLHEPENSKQDEHSPRLLAAAEILHEIRFSSIQNQSSEKIKWPKKLSQKAMKARKSRSPLRKTEVTPITPKCTTGHSDEVMNLDRSTPSKKPKFTITSERKEIVQISNNGKAPMKWSNPTTSSRLEKGLVSDTKKLNTSRMKLLKPFNNSQQKMRKPLFIDWARGRNKKE